MEINLELSILLSLVLLHALTLVSILIVFIKLKGEKERLLEEKSVIYTRFVESWHVLYSKHSELLAPVEETPYLLPIRDMKKQILLWASQEVLREYNDLESLLSQGEISGSPRLLKQYTQLIIAMRQDLGEKSSLLKTEDFL